MTWEHRRGMGKAEGEACRQQPANPHAIGENTMLQIRSNNAR